MKISRSLKAVAILITAILFSGNALFAELPEKPQWMPEVSASSSFMTKYIWRGWNLGDEPVMQLDGSLSKNGITAGVWANYSFNDDRSRDGGRYKEFTELDYYVDYTFNVGEMAERFLAATPPVLDGVDFSTGYTYYTFPDIDRSAKEYDSHELYLGMAYDYVVTPHFTWYWDFGTGGGSYYVFGLSYDKEISHGIIANLGMTTGYVQEQWTDESGWGDMVFSTSLDIPAFEYFTISPSFAYSVILDKDTYGGVSENEYYGGLSVAFNY